MSDSMVLVLDLLNHRLCIRRISLHACRWRRRRRRRRQWW